MIEELSRELGAVGIRGRLRARILAEAAEHVREGSPDAFGDPRALALQFADELGPEEARRAAWGSFAALAVAGAAYTLAFGRLAATTTPPADIFGGRHAPLGFLASIGLILLPQVSFAAGALAPLARSPRVAIRRAAVALTAGAGSLASALVFAWEFGVHSAVLWATLPAGAGLVAATALTVRAGRIRLAAASGDVFDDLGPLVPDQLRGHPWRFALVVTALVAVAVGIAGSSGGDPGEGIRNAIAESLACMSGFVVLGKFLGLRH